MEVLERLWPQIMEAWAAHGIWKGKSKYPHFSELRRQVRYLTVATEDVTKPEYVQFMKKKAPGYKVED